MVEISRSEFEEIIQEYDCAVNDVEFSTYDTFYLNLKIFLKLLNENNFFAHIINSSLPQGNFDQWYIEAKKTVKGMVGSGNLEWPLIKEQRLSMQKSLLESLADKKEDIPNFCSKFMYAGSKLDDCGSKFNEQIFSPFARDLKRLIEKKIPIKTQENYSVEENRMTLKEKIENHPVIWVLGLLIIGFIAGFNSYKVILEITGQTTISKEKLELLSSQQAVTKIDSKLNESIGKEITELTDLHNIRLTQLQTRLLEEEKQATNHANIEIFQKKHEGAALRIRGSIKQENESFRNHLMVLKDLQTK